MGYVDTAEATGGVGMQLRMLVEEARSPWKEMHHCEKAHRENSAGTILTCCHLTSMGTGGLPPSKPWVV